MKVKKFTVIAVLSMVLFAGSAFAFQPEDALSSRPEDSIYTMLKIQDASKLLQWAFSKENVDIFAPLFMKGKSKLEILAVSEFVNALVAMAPVRSAAVVIGMTKNDTKQKAQFVQAALTFSYELNTTIKRIEAGLADASDVAKLLIGDKIAADFVESMIKLEKEKDNIYRVNNDIFMAAVDGKVLLGSSVNEIRRAIKAINDKDTRLLNKKARKFTAEDFALVHIDYETVTAINTDNGKLSDDFNVTKYFAKPLEIEFAFTRQTDKFVISTTMNAVEALRKKYADELLAMTAKWEYTKGGNIDLDFGGTTSPLFALGTHIDFEAMNELDEYKPILKAILRNMRVRFGVADEETKALLAGPFSLVVNDTVTYEGFKIPAVYVSQKGKKGAVAKVYDRLTQSQHFSKVKDGILQLDSSISPVSCLVADRGEKIGVYFAELSSLEQKPVLNSALADLLSRESTASTWVDFAGIQSWILDENNGVMAMLAPLMMFGGYGKYFKALQDVLTAELSVPSMSIWGKAPEFLHIEFAVKEINPENGLFMRIRKAYQELNAAAESKKAPADDKASADEKAPVENENRKEKSE